MTEFVYCLAIIGTYIVIKYIYMEEHRKHNTNYLEKAIILLISVGTFASMFLVMAYYTVRYPPHDQKIVL